MKYLNLIRKELLMGLIVYRVISENQNLAYSTGLNQPIVSFEV